MPWRRKWQTTPLFLPGESQGWRSLVDCCLWSMGSHRVGHDWSDLAVAAAGEERDDRGWDGWTASLTQRTWVWVKLWEMVKDRGTWHAAVHGFAKSQTQLSHWTPALFHAVYSNYILQKLKKWYSYALDICWEKCLQTLKSIVLFLTCLSNRILDISQENFL